MKENWLKMISIHSSVSVWFEVRSSLRNIYDHFWQLWPLFVKGAEIPLVTIVGLRISGSSQVASILRPSSLDCCHLDFLHSSPFDQWVGWLFIETYCAT